MDLYHVALYLHIVTLLIASGVTAVTKLAAGRRDHARTVGEFLEWHKILLSTAKIFPMCLAAFVITGGYMMSVNGASWSTGFVVAGLVGVAWLFATGAFMGIKGGALTKMLEGMASKGADQPAPKLAPPPMIMMLPIINPFVALAVAFDMVTKPVSIPVALGVVGVGFVVGTLVAMRRPAPAPQPVAAA
jgi:hypothetical protein